MPTLSTAIFWSLCNNLLRHIQILFCWMHSKFFFFRTLNNKLVSNGWWISFKYEFLHLMFNRFHCCFLSRHIFNLQICDFVFLKIIKLIELLCLQEDILPELNCTLQKSLHVLQLLGLVCGCNSYCLSPMQ